MANPMLLWFVGYFNMTSIVIVTLCFLAMTIFIGFISMNGDYYSRSSVHIGIEQRNMVKMSNPFFLQIEESNRKLTDGLHLHLSSLLPSKIFVLWGARINPFHDLILKPGTHLRKMFVLNKQEDYRDLDILHLDKTQFLEAGEHNVELCCPDSVNSQTLGDMPRKRYPVTVFIFIPESSSQNEHSSLHSDGDILRDELLQEEDTASQNENSIIGLIAIIHLRDDKVTQGSHIVGQYVKSSGIPLFSLQPLYLNSNSSQNKNRGDVKAQHQTVNRKLSCKNSAVISGASNNEINGEHSTGTSLSSPSAGDKQKHCASCSNASKSRPVMSKHNSTSTDYDTRATNICDQCRTSCKTLTDDEHNVRDVHKQGRSSETLSDLTDDDNDADEPDNQTDSEAECVVCQTHRVRCVLLPCRHACVCLGCFKLLYRCPMCRAGIESYFLLQNNLTTEGDVVDDDEVNEEDEEVALQDLQHQAVNASFHQMWQRLNTRLNDFLGFR